MHFTLEALKSAREKGPEVLSGMMEAPGRPGFWAPKIDNEACEGLRTVPDRLSDCGARGGKAQRRHAHEGEALEMHRLRSLRRHLLQERRADAPRQTSRGVARRKARRDLRRTSRFGRFARGRLGGQAQDDDQRARLPHLTRRPVHCRMTENR